MTRPRLGLIFLIVLVDIISFSMLVPVLPYLALSLGASTEQAGLLTGLYALCQFVGAPILGRLSDTFGRKPMFLLDIAANIIGFVILASANSLWMLFLARFIAGCMSANIPIAQAYIADITTPENRSNAIGILGAAFGLGFTIGPAFGGILSKYGYTYPALLSALLCVVNFLIIILFLPESVHKHNAEAPLNELDDRKGSPVRSFVPPSRSLVDISLIRRIAGDSRIATLLVFWVTFSIAFAMFQQNIALFNKLHLNLTPKETGFIFTWIGVLVFAMQAGVLRLMTKRFSDEQLILLSAPLLALSLLIWAFAPSWLVLVLLLVPLCFAASTLITVINSMLTKLVAPADVGGAMGIAGAIDNSTRFITAFSGGVLLQRIGTFAPGIVAALVMGLGIALLRGGNTNPSIEPEQQTTSERQQG
ncbi:MAG: MFS transporter [Candidatus Kapabacteria bacterium]|jgi:DHA1 family tetracycline resistance protein-like MFS transporter|nr:MFS transporter [Candidatus Kapabacteria bacterium]